ncbi:MAG: TatD family hydrolase [Zoogloeaceae bacterium]|nr:TatD family hydrolase [Zoogloeaceae bacterium]
MWIDTHCHLDAAEFAPDRDQVVAAAHAAGVSRIIVPAVELHGFAAVRDCCQRYAGCFPAYGIHPMYTPAAQESDLQALREWLENERPLAVGEIGLDYFVPGLDRERQQFFFIEQLKLAREFNLPVLLHVRRAIDLVLKALRQIRVPGGIAHAFNGSRQQAEVFIGLGFKLGFGGAMTWPRATHLRELASGLPADSLVLETDAPDMSPVFLAVPPGGQPQRQRNAPEYLPRIAETLAHLRGISLAEVATLNRRNAESVMPLLP